MKGQSQPVSPAAMLTADDIQAWYQDNPFALGTVDTICPLEESDSDKWETVSNVSYLLNEAANPLSQHASIPVAGREGYQTVIGGMAEFGAGREMDSRDLEKFEKLKMKLAKAPNAANAQALIDYYGADLRYVRTAMQAERMYLTYALLSSACSIGFVASNSPYMQGITAMQYPVAAYQKDVVSTAWSNPAALILDDIQSAIDLFTSKGKMLTKIKINSTWFNYVRKNTQIQKYCATMVQNLFTTQAPPTVEAINTMMADYFGQDIQFEVIKESITRVSGDGSKVTSNPFADGVAVFTAATQVGRFVWNPLYILDPAKEVYESFFTVGNYMKTDPSYNKIYAKGKGFPVIDTYDSNFYLKINAVAW